MSTLAGAATEEEVPMLNGAAAAGAAEVLMVGLVWFGLCVGAPSWLTILGKFRLLLAFTHNR